MLPVLPESTTLNEIPALWNDIKAVQVVNPRTAAD